VRPAGSNIASTGAYSLCSALQGASVGAPVTVLNEGVPVNIRGNKVPQAPTWKFSAGAQYTHHLANEWTLVPRVDLSYTGEQQTSIFGTDINRIKGFVQANAQVQLNGPDDRWFLRGFVENLFDSDATTGLFVSDASTGLFTNLFALEPRRYGIAAGMRF
jgi:outer membrane receptor protein involved in Fe transport